MPAARVGIKDLDCCCGRQRGTGGLQGPGIGRPVLVDHFSKPFGEVEVRPDGEEALCSGAEGVWFIHSVTETRTETEPLALRGSQV
jgi:hypothetical protein